MKPGKKPKPKIKIARIASKTTAQGIELGTVAIAVAIVVLVPVVLDANVLLFDPPEAYDPHKFKVFMGCSAALLVTVLGVVVLRREPLKVPVLIPALAFLGVSALSALFSEDPWHSLFGDRYAGLLSLAAGVLLFYALARCLNSPLRVRIFLAAGVTAAVLVSIFGISQKYGLDPISGWGVPWYTDTGRPFSTLGNPLFLAAYLTLMMGAATALCFKAGSWKGRAPWLFALAIMGACWLYTDERGPMLSAGVALPMVLWFSRRRMGTARPLLAPLAILVVAGIAAVAAAAAFGNLTSKALIATIPAGCLALMGAILWFSRRRMGTARPLLAPLAILVVAGIAAVAAAAAFGNLALLDRATSTLLDDPNVQSRQYNWRDTVPMILDRPLLGHGPDNFKEPFEPYISEELEALLTTHGVQFVDRTHNELLQVSATTGLLGLAAYLWVFVSYFRNVYRRGGWPLIALSGGVLAYILQLQTVFPTIATSVAFWAILGASVAVMRIHDREGGEPNPNTTQAGNVGEALTTETPSGRAYELLVVAIVVGVLTALAVPTFLDQREKVARFERAAVTRDVALTVTVYEQAKAQSGTYPEAGVYTTTDPIEGGGISFHPNRNVTITTTTPAGGGFTIEGESTTLSGTFGYSYDSATGAYTQSW
ncbi:MAG: O-antigen ligase family protein [Actinomycetota bacterium]|nr:O-antigen ligase family protein [Actinomycetota bacterium]